MTFRLVHPESDPPAEDRAAPTAAPGDRPRLLMLTHRLPVPPNRGDRIRAYHLLKTLGERFAITLACLSERPPTVDEHAMLGELVDTADVRVTSPRRAKLRGAAALLRCRPATPACFFRRDLADALVFRHRAGGFDAILTFCSGMIGYAKAVLDATPIDRRVPVHVLDLVDVDSAKWDAYADERPAWDPMRRVYAAEARRLAPIERGDAVACDAITVVSSCEADAYRRRYGLTPRLRVVPNGVDLDAFHPPRVERAVPGRVVFVGQMDYPPNVDAVAWFARHVMPILRERRPDATFRIVGRSPSPAVLALHDPAGRGVEVVGEVDDVVSELHAASVVVAPLRIARGVQNKVLEAMAAGRAVVCSPQAAEGIDAEPGRELAIAETPEQWAREAVYWMKHPPARRHLGAAARRRVERDRAWPAAVAPMVELLTPRPAAPATRVA